MFSELRTQNFELRVVSVAPVLLDAQVPYRRRYLTETQEGRGRIFMVDHASFPPVFQLCDLPVVQRYLTADFKIFPAENFGTLTAGILSASPVLGFRPSRAFRLATVKVPKFTSETRCPLFREVVTAPVKACSALPAATFVIPADAAIFAISSSFVIKHLLLLG
jgi:hypothetical protein